MKGNIAAHEAATIAARLSPAQRSIMQGMDRDFATLGFGEKIAKNLCEPRSSRPALLIRRRGDEFWEFAVSDSGAAVKEVM